MNYEGGICDKRARTFTIMSYTKHYYIGSERISAKTGTCVNIGYYPQGYLATKMPNLDANLVRTSSDDKVDKAENNINYVHEKLSLNPPALNSTNDYVEESSNFNHLRNLDYFYFHPDHLGSSSYITNAAGTVSQHMEYLPFGETLVDEHTNSYNSPFKYNGKEFDEETGNYFYGARYYDPRLSIFISVDPLAEQAPDWTPYRYGFNNPIRYTDPTGMYEEDNDYWIVYQGKSGNTQVIYDEEIKTREQAETKYNNISDFFKSGTLTGIDDNNIEYTYKLNEGGTVTDVNTSSIIEKGFITPRGTYIGENKSALAQLAPIVSNSGDAAVFVGAILVITGIGAPLGAGLITYGGYTSVAGTSMDLINDANNGNWSNEKVVTKTALQLLPLGGKQIFSKLGAPAAGELFNVGTTGADRLLDEFREAKVGPYREN